MVEQEEDLVLVQVLVAVVLYMLQLMAVEEETEEVEQLVLEAVEEVVPLQLGQLMPHKRQEVRGVTH